MTPTIKASANTIGNFSIFVSKVIYENIKYEFLLSSCVWNRDVVWWNFEVQ
jgi:hypothetical protein